MEGFRATLTSKFGRAIHGNRPASATNTADDPESDAAPYKSKKHRIIIVGGGFAGVKCAKTLSRAFPRNQIEVILFNRENHLVFSPLLAEAVGSSVNPLDVVVPLRQMLPHVYCRTESVRSINPENNEIEYETEDARLARMSYDHLVLACGNAANLHVVPGMADYAFPLKNVADAMALRAHVMQAMEKAEVSADPERRRWHLTFIVVGGGYSGVEVAGEINDLVCSSTRYFKHFGKQDVTVILIHSRSQILPEIGSHLREFTRRKMEESGVTVMLNTCVKAASPEGVTLADGRDINGGTIVCTIGNSPASIVQNLDVPKERGRLETEPDMRLCDFPNIWAIGDCALIRNQHDGRPSPPTGQFAERQGNQCAQNIIRTIKGCPTMPFRFKPLGELCSIGGHSAVAELFGVDLAGFIAWFIWRGIYLFKLPTWSRRFQVGLDWLLLLLFPRDLSHLRIRETERVSRTRYQSGDFIFQQGEPRTDFYVVIRGEVEVLRETLQSPDGKVVAVCGPGCFFGEKSLLNAGPRITSVRARSETEVLVMGKNVFTQISPALGPLRDAVAQTLNSRPVPQEANT
jgi:NADH:ubiquinone reductase (H+-translocating)